MVSIDIRTALESARLSGNVFTCPVSRVDGPLDLDGVSLGHVDFRNVRFSGPIKGRRVKMKGLAWFDGAIFDAETDFSGAVFGLDARFDGAQFGGDARFSATEFCGGAIFDRTRFRAAARFDGSLFFAGFSMDRACVEGLASFRNAEAMGGAWFAHAQFQALDMRGLVIQGRGVLSDATYRAAEGRARLAQLGQATFLGYERG